MRRFLATTISLLATMPLSACLRYEVRPLSEFGLSADPEKTHFFVTSEKASGFYYAQRDLITPRMTEAQMRTAGFGPHSIEKRVSPDAGPEYRFVPICRERAVRQGQRIAPGDRSDVVKLINLPCP